MLFIVEDGTGLTNANSYSDVAFADAYFLDRGVTDWSGTDSEKQIFLISATDYIELRWGRKLKGSIEFPENPQALSFPRINIKDRNGLIISGIDDKLKKATCEYALIKKGGNLVSNPVYDDSGLLLSEKSEKIGPIGETVKYLAGSSASQGFKYYPVADGFMSDFISSGPTGNRRVIR